jgi:ribokinase
VPRVCVIGSANVDYTVGLARLPTPGETVSGGALLVNLGGKGANQAVAVRRLGGEVRMVGCVGDDPDGRRIAESLSAAGIDVSGLTTALDAATGTALIMVDAQGRNQIAVAPGANHRLTVDMVASHGGSIAWADVVACQLETPLPVVRWALGEARRQQVTTVLNPAPVQPLDAEILGLVDYLTPNEHEAARLTELGVDTLEDAGAAASRLRASGARVVLVTLGDRGVLACEGESIVHFPAFPVEAVDTTAAGDAFNGALAVGLAAGGSLEQAIPLANAAAALACTKRGAQDSLPRREEVEAFLRSLGGRSR